MSTKITVSSLGDAVRDKVRKAIMDSIPDEAMDSLVKAEFDRFFKDTNEYSRSQPSPFKILVQNEIQNLMKERVKELIKTKVDSLTEEWSGNGISLVGQLVEEMAPHVLAGLSKNIAMNCIAQLRNGNVYG